MRLGQSGGGEGADCVPRTNLEGLPRDPQTAVPLNPAGVGFEQSGEDVEQRGLAAAVLTDDGQPGPVGGGDGQGDAAQDGATAPGDGDVLGAQMGRGVVGLYRHESELPARVREPGKREQLPGVAGQRREYASQRRRQATGRRRMKAMPGYMPPG